MQLFILIIMGVSIVSCQDQIKNPPFEEFGSFGKF